MKRMQLIVMAAAILLVSGTAMAAGNATLNVSATVNATCSMTGTGTLTFPALDPTVGAAAVATGSGINITCTNGTPYSVTSSSLNLGNLKNGANVFPYTITLPAAASGTGAPVAYDVTGNIAAGAYSTMPAGVYTDTVTLNITP